MVVVKSISRFARNTFTMLKTVRELKALELMYSLRNRTCISLTAEGEMVLF